MQGLGIRIARAINRALGLKGRALKERYHMRILETPTEVRNVLRYVLNNFRKHVGPIARDGPWDGLDPFTSGRYFDGWVEAPRVRVPPPSEPPVTSPCTWLLAVGWRLLGRISLSERPG